MCCIDLSTCCGRPRYIFHSFTRANKQSLGVVETAKPALSQQTMAYCDRQRVGNIVLANLQLSKKSTKNLSLRLLCALGIRCSEFTSDTFPHKNTHKRLHWHVSHSFRDLRLWTSTHETAPSYITCAIAISVHYKQRSFLHALRAKRRTHTRKSSKYAEEHAQV